MKLHGNDIQTEWAMLFNDKTELTEFALKFSNDNNIVESKDWANLKPENGLDGGDTFTGLSAAQKYICRELKSIASSKQVHSVDRRTNASKRMIGNKNGLGNKSRTGQKQSMEERQKKSESLKGEKNPNYRKKLPNWRKDEIRAAMLSRPKLKCPHCSKEIDPANYKRYHGDICKSRIDS